MVNPPKIYVSIASYRDPFLQRTIDSLYCTADNPQNITVACFIHAFPEELQDKVPFNRYGYSVVYETELPGTIFSVTQCRNRCLKWLDDSYDYVLQVDAHTAFDNGWDTQLVQMINSVNYKKAILSGALSSFGVYPDGQEVRNKVIAARTFYLNNKDTKKAFINASDMAPNGTIVDPLPGKDYAHGWYIAGHFIFSPADYFRDIPQPEWILFWGEEVINSVRAYTAGWNVYIFEDIPLYHLDENVTFTGRPRLWEDFPNQWFPKREPASDRIVDIMNNINVVDGDLFYERSLDDLYNHIGHDLGKLFLEWREERRGKRTT
jgi:hypothetical protein